MNAGESGTLDAGARADGERLERGARARGLDFLAYAGEVVAHMPREQRLLAEELSVSAAAIVAHTATRSFGEAHQAAYHCAAILDITRSLDLLSTERCARGEDILERLVPTLEQLLGLQVPALET